MLYVEYEDQTNSTLFSSCSTEIIPLISDHRQIEVLRYIIDIHILRSQILHIFTFPLLNRPMFQMNKRPMFRMFRQCFLVPALPCFECYHYCLILFTDFFSGKRWMLYVPYYVFFHHRFAVSTNKELHVSQPINDLLCIGQKNMHTCTRTKVSK